MGGILGVYIIAHMNSQNRDPIWTSTCYDPFLGTPKEVSLILGNPKPQ